MNSKIEHVPVSESIYKKYTYYYIILNFFLNIITETILF